MTLKIEGGGGAKSILNGSSEGAGGGGEGGGGDEGGGDGKLTKAQKKKMKAKEKKAQAAEEGEVPDVPFEVRFSLGNVISFSGAVLFVICIGKFLLNNGESDVVSTFGFVYAIPALVGGLALKYAELPPVNLDTSAAAESAAAEAAAAAAGRAAERPPRRRPPRY